MTDETKTTGVLIGDDGIMRWANGEPLIDPETQEPVTWEEIRAEAAPKIVEKLSELGIERLTHGEKLREFAERAQVLGSAGPMSDDQKEAFDTIVDAARVDLHPLLGLPPIALLSGFLDGEEAAFLCVVVAEEQHDTETNLMEITADVFPVAVMLDSRLMAKVTGPEGEPLGGDTGEETTKEQGDGLGRY